MRRDDAARRGRVPLLRALSKLGLASRGVAREWILAGRVAVNGVVRRDPLHPASPERDRIEIDGRTAAAAPFRAVAFHKPRGTTVTRSDERGRPTIYSVLPPEFESLHPVGRLDLATSGLLLLTNDTRLSAWLADPDNRVPRIYVAVVRGRAAADLPERLTAGVVDAGERLRAESAVVEKASGRESRVRLVLTEGRNREVRRLLAAFGHETRRLVRVSYGGLELGDLPAGAVRELTPAEIARAFPGAPAPRRMPGGPRR